MMKDEMVGWYHQLAQKSPDTPGSPVLKCPVKVGNPLQTTQGK